MLSDLTARLGEIRTDWNLDEVEALFALPFNDLLFHAQRVHRQYFDPNSVQVSTLLSIKTGACPEDCAYCPQSVRFDTAVETERLMEVEDVLEQAKELPNAPTREDAAGRKDLRGLGLVTIDGTQDVQTLLSQSDMACYAAKDRGRNCVVVRVPKP